MLSKTTCGLILLAATLFSGAVHALDAKNSDNACKRSAGLMYKACWNDVRDDYLVTLANCVNISDASERLACRLDAGETSQEEGRFCGDVREAREDACEALGEDRYDPDPLLDPTKTFVDPDEVGDAWPVNPYVSVVAGHTYVLDVTEDGELAEKVIVHVTDDKRDILGVECRVVVDIVVEEDDGEFVPVEVTDDWFAQDTLGDVYYCGEVAQNFEDGVLRDLDGSFEAGREFAKSGLLISSAPVVGVAHRQEFSLGEAEDIIQYVALSAVPTEEEGGENELFPCAPGGCLKTFEFAPIDPESTEYKYYVPGIGFVLAVAMEDGDITGEREELVCVGDSLDVLSDDPNCGIEDPAALLEALCRLSPDAFCD